MKKVLVQIRKEEKSIAKKYIAEAFNISSTTLNRWIKNGQIYAPTGEDNTYTLRDIELLFVQRGVPKLSLRGKGKKYFEDIIQCKLMLIRNGIFLVPSDATEEKETAYFDRAIDRDGLVNTQGLSNHVHLCDCGVKNPVFQLILAKQLNDRWLQLVRSLKFKTKTTVIIDWRGKVDTSICVYNLNPQDKIIFDKIESDYGIHRARM